MHHGGEYSVSRSDSVTTTERALDVSYNRLGELKNRYGPCWEEKISYTCRESNREYSTIQPITVPIDLSPLYILWYRFIENVFKELRHWKGFLQHMHLFRTKSLPCNAVLIPSHLERNQEVKSWILFLSNSVSKITAIRNYTTILSVFIEYKWRHNSRSFWIF
jgi:hypothetical protein